jgi:hypothetical protein
VSPDLGNAQRVPHHGAADAGGAVLQQRICTRVHLAGHEQGRADDKRPGQSELGEQEEFWESALLFRLRGFGGNNAVLIRVRVRVTG